MFKFSKIVLVSLLIFVFSNVFAQIETKTYVVYLNGKSKEIFNPYSYFDIKNIERKQLAHLPLYDKRDLPLNHNFVNQIESPQVNILVASRWLNALFVKTNFEQITRIKTLPFVKQVDVYYASKQKVIASENIDLLGQNKKILAYQTERLQAKEFINNNFTGKGIRIAVFDIGFSGANKHEAFAHLRSNKQIKYTYDFINKNENVYLGGAHGTNTLSCITGIYKGQKMGMATDAEFLLARTEWELKEDKQEEYFWLAAAEWADKNGVNIISSSLGYGSDWYNVNDMDGKKSVVAFAATVAAQKGILVVNSAGNEYQDDWKTIITPSDADSVLCIGGTNPFNDRHISFSSIGPSADYRKKPNISAPGHVVAANPNGSVSTTFGTSFSCPLVSGFAACAWQSNRSLTNMQLFAEIEKSGHLYPYFDYMHGHGIPQASYFTNTNKTKALANFVIIDSLKQNNEITIQITDSAILNKVKVFEAFKASAIPKVDSNNKNIPHFGFNFYWNIANAEGKILHYEVILINTTDDIIIRPENTQKGNILNFHFEGYNQTKTIE
ncbi:MAG: S8 family serine peptidase [Bacteroidia bacterium]|nr:S8 family serine peptidase [Bacteroidia bacterium]